MKTRIGVSSGLVVKVLCIMSLGLMALQGSAAAEDTVKGSMKFGDAAVSYIDAAGGVFTGNGNIIVSLSDEKDKREEVIKQIQEDGTVAGMNHLDLTFDKKGKLLYHGFQFSQGSSSNSAGGSPAEGIVSKVKISKGRAAGRVYAKEPLMLFDNKYTFDVTFDVEIADGK